MNDAIVKQSLAAREILADQLTSLEGVQRFNSNRQVNIYFRDDAARFPNDREELSVARARYRRDGARISVEIVCHRGVLSTLEFSKDPKPICLDTAELVGVESLVDLMTTPYRVTGADDGTVAKLREVLGVQLVFEEVMGPAPPSELERLSMQIGRLPQDLELLLSIADGWKCRGWSFLGTRCRRIPRHAETLIAIAEGAERALCIGAETFRGWVLFDGITEVGELLEDNLTRVLQKLLSENEVRP